MSKHVTICLAFTRPSKEGLNTCQLSVFQKQKLWRVRKNWFFFNWGHSVYKLSKPLDPTHTEQNELGPAFVSHGWSLRTWLELHGETGDILSQSCNFKQPGMSQDLCILCSLWVSMTQGWQTGKMVYNWVCVMMHKMSGTTNTQKLRDPTPASPPDDSDLLANSENSTPFEVKLWCPAKTDPSRSFNPSPYPRPFESCLKLMMHCKVHAAVQPGIKKNGWYGGFWELGHNSHGWRKSTQAKCRLRIQFDATWRPKKLFCASLCDARWNWLTNRTPMKRGSKYLGNGRCFLKQARDEPILRKYIDSSFLLIQQIHTNTATPC